MFENFCNWGQQIARYPKHIHGSVEFKINEPCDNRSARLDMTTQNAVAEIVVWSSGDYFAEIIDVATEKTRYQISGVIAPGQQIETLFEDFFDDLAKG